MAEPTAKNTRWVNTVLIADHTMGSLGLFTLMPVIAVLLADQFPDAGAVAVGAALFCYMLAQGLSALLLSQWLPRFPYVASMTASVLMSATGFGLLPYAGTFAVALVLLFLAGLGVSVHFVLSRVLIAELITDEIGRHRVYSALQIALNAAATAGPFIAGFCYVAGSGDGRLLLGIVTVCYVVAGLTIVSGLPRGARPAATATRWPISREVLSFAVRDGATRRVALITMLGSFVYAQFFSAFALLVAKTVAVDAMRGALLAGPAIAIVVLQAMVTRGVNGWQRRGVRPFAVLAGATLLFGLSMLALGAGLTPMVGALAGVLLFSFAEMLFTPMVSTAFAGLAIPSQLEAFNLRQVSWTTGEALGSWCGGSVFLALYVAGAAPAYWLVLGALTIAGVGVLVLGDRRGATGTAAEPVAAAVAGPAVGAGDPR
jgi:MFS family permease